MEHIGDWELKNLANELTLGKELAKQLQINLNAPSSSHETRELLVHKILGSYEKALHILKARETPDQHVTGGGTSGTAVDYPRSLSGSPRSEDSDREFSKDQRTYSRETPRKRKTLPRWTKHVQVTPGTGLEGSLDDRYSWRKYGQKDILGAKYPRGYYRCTHRPIQGCLATKQVQRTDDDPTIFEITYRGIHTCNQSPHPNPNPPPSGSINQDPASSGGSHQPTILPPQQNQQQTLLNFQSGLEVITHTSTTANDLESYSFFSSCTRDNDFGANACPSLMSPGTCGSNFFTVSSSEPNIFAGNLSSNVSESDLSALVSAAASATSSPTVGLNLPFGRNEIGHDFTSDNLGFFS